MSFESFFLDLMPDTVVIKARTSSDFYGNASYGAASTYRCHVSYKVGQLTGSDGMVVHYDTTVWVASTSATAIRPDMQATLGSNFAATKPVLKVERYEDSDGPHHVKLYLGHS